MSKRKKFRETERMREILKKLTKKITANRVLISEKGAPEMRLIIEG